MVFVACGLNHKTAPLNIREKVALPQQMHKNILSSLISLPAINEATILSTCNRTEIYCDTKNPEQITSWLNQNHQLNEDISSYLYLYPGQAGIRHILRVATGLDSMMLGEPQILGQLKQAYQEACEIGAVKHNLRNIFEYIFSASKRIRNQSGIGNNPISVAYAAVQLIRHIFAKSKDLTIFLIGSGDTSTAVAKYLVEEGVKQFIFASRTIEHAYALADTIPSIFDEGFGKIINIMDIPQYLAEADIIISATSCPVPFINKEMAAKALTQRAGQAMFFLDLAVPRDIEPNVSELENVHLYNIDDLQNVVFQGLKERQLRAEQAEQLIDVELENYIRHHRSRKAKDLIREYRDTMQNLANEELQRALQKLNRNIQSIFQDANSTSLQDEICRQQYAILNEFSERLFNKLIHIPTISLRYAAGKNQQELLELAQNLLKHEKIS